MITINDPILWTEGMLLTPQHFQQQNIYQEHQALHLLHQVQPYFWGLMDIAIDESALADGQFTIKHIHAVMPDGMVVQQGDKFDRPIDLTLDINEQDLGSGEQCTLFLRVPVHTAGSACDTGALQRFEPYSGLLETDDTNLEGRVQIDRLKPQLELWVGGESSSNYVAISLGQLNKTAAGQFELGPLHPPLLRLSASDFLGAASLQNRLKSLLKKLRFHAGYLANTHQINGTTLFAFTTALPGLELTLKDPTSHPYEILKSLANLYGQLATLSSNPMPETLIDYDHNIPSKSMDQVIKLITDLIDSVPVNYELYPFQQEDEHSFSLYIKTEWSLDNFIVELRPKSWHNRNDIDSWLAATRIGTRSLMPTLQQQRSPGALIHDLDVAGHKAISKNSDQLFYRLENIQISAEGEVEDVIQNHQELIFKGSPELFGPAEIIFYRKVREVGL